MNINQHDLSDDELDRLFSDAAEKMEADFDPDSWTKMNQKLDAANSATSGKSQTRSVWLNRGLSLLLASLFMVGVYYFLKPAAKSEQETAFQNKQKNDSEKNIEENAKKDVITDKVDTDNLENKKTDIDNASKESTNNSESNNYNKEGINNKIISTNKIADKKETSSDKATVDLTKSENTLVSNKRTEVKSSANTIVSKNAQNSATATIKTSDDLVENNTVENNIFSTKNEVNIASNKNTKTAKNKKSKANTLDNSNVSYETGNVITSQNLVSQNTETSLQAPQIIEQTQEKNNLGNLKNLMPKNGNFKARFILPRVAFASPKATPVIPKSTSFKQGFYLRLGISPDFSAVSFNETAKLGSNWAALLEYRLNKRLSVQSGVIRSMKYYNAYAASYTWPTNWGTVPYSLVDINASCKMLDIPLNVRFDLSQKSKSRWFVGAGLTSYVMKNEKYTYNYANPNSSWIKWREWEGVSQKKPFYISTMNFSLGYEQQFFRKLSIQAEPFYKAPLKKVGFGKVNLSTIGILVSAKYPITK